MHARPYAYVCIYIFMFVPSALELYNHGVGRNSWAQILPGNDE